MAIFTPNFLGSRLSRLHSLDSVQILLCSSLPGDFVPVNLCKSPGFHSVILISLICFQLLPHLGLTEKLKKLRLGRSDEQGLSP